MDNEENQPSRPTGNIKTMSENPIANELIPNYKVVYKMGVLAQLACRPGVFHVHKELG